MERVVLSADIGGTHIRFAVVDLDGNLIKIVKRRLDRSVKGDGLEQIASQAVEIAEWADSSGMDVLGIGIGIAGKIDCSSGKVIFSPNLPEVNGKNISKSIADRVGKPVFLDNDANVFGRGELWKGAGKGFDNWLGITLGTGVGGCVVLKREVWTGDYGIGFAGEIGHMTIYPDGLPCACGKQGCLEAYASEGGLLRMVEKEGLYRGVENLSAEFIYRKAMDEDLDALRLYDIFGKALGVGIANAFSLLGLRYAIIGGGVSQAWRAFEKSMYRALYSNCSMLDPDQILVVKSELGDKASLLGAAKLVLDSI